MSIQSRLKSVEQRATERAERKREESCVCAYTETTDGEEMSEETARAVESNVLCFERNHAQRSHVGFNTVIVGRSVPVEDNTDDAPLVA